jgi:hypothetical protein
MKQSEIIVQVGSEGGDVTLYGARTENGWIFSREVVDQSLLLLDQPEIRHTSGIAESWAAGLELIDQYPWQHLFPIEVHQEFRQLVFDAVLARFQGEGKEDPWRLSRWKGMCGIVAPVGLI